MRFTLFAMFLLTGCVATDPYPPVQDEAAADAFLRVHARLETEPVDVEGDAADDPAIWIDPRDPARSVVIGTQKRGALFLYDLAGQELQRVPAGQVNNVDLRYDFRFSDGTEIDLIAASNRSFNGISLFRMEPDERQAVEITADQSDSGLAAIYGLCMGRNPASGTIYVYANSRDGVVYQYRAVGRDDGKVDLRRVRTLRLNSQPEGCVVDDRSGQLYIGEEAVGVWRFDAWPQGSDHGVLIARVGSDGLVADVEGLAIGSTDSGGYLVVSSQGNNSFAVFDLPEPHAYRGSFAVVDGPHTDGAEETDGIELVITSLGPFPAGLLVVQDGYNTQPEANQNFKYVDWGEVVRVLALDR